MIFLSTLKYITQSNSTLTVFHLNNCVFHSNKSYLLNMIKNAVCCMNKSVILFHKQWSTRPDRLVVLKDRFNGRNTLNAVEEVHEWKKKYRFTNGLGREFMNRFKNIFRRG